MMRDSHMQLVISAARETAERHRSAAITARGMAQFAECRIIEEDPGPYHQKANQLGVMSEAITLACDHLEQEVIAR